MNHIAPIQSVQRVQDMKFGASMTNAGARFRLWAPHCDSVGLRIAARSEADLPMRRLPRGWFELEVAGAAAGDLYSFVLADGMVVPDPASRHQPNDVHAASELIDPRAYAWGDLGWGGRPWEEAVLYELHVGTFTAEGTFRAAIDKLDHLVALGVTAVELLPVADFEGRWNWGYDGVLLFAPDNSYGRPEDMKAFIDAAHQRGLMVLLDVVYNHFGPSGNYMDAYAPLLTGKHQTPWGSGVNYDDVGAGMVREMIFANVRYWLNEYHLDGLRLDAVHAIRDDGPRHLLEELAEKARGATDGRHVHLIVENPENQAGWLVRHDDLRPRLYTAQWSEDIHHGLHSAVTGESFWYYSDYHGRIDLLARALAEGQGFQGEHSAYEGRPKGEPSAFLPPTAFVAYLQNHDQSGNRPLGERLHMLSDPAALSCVTAILLLSPQIPMLFMGEEWDSATPFLFFSDLQELAKEIRSGRAEEFKGLGGDVAPDKLPDPMAEATFRMCKLDWNELQTPDAQAALALRRGLLDIRHTEIVPRLAEMEGNAGSYALIEEQGLQVSWRLGDGARLRLVANLSATPLKWNDPGGGRVIWSQAIKEDALGPWAVLWTIEEAKHA